LAPKLPGASATICLDSGGAVVLLYIVKCSIIDQVEENIQFFWRQKAWLQRIFIAIGLRISQQNPVIMEMILLIRAIAGKIIQSIKGSHHEFLKKNKKG
jgi:hypothetical protein